MFCGKCGNALSDDAKFCNNCGAVIANAQQMTENQNINNQYAGVSFVSHNNKKAALIVAVLISLIIFMCPFVNLCESKYITYIRYSEKGKSVYEVEDKEKVLLNAVKERKILSGISYFKFYKQLCYRMLMFDDYEFPASSEALKGLEGVEIQIEYKIIAYLGLLSIMICLWVFAVLNVISLIKEVLGGMKNHVTIWKLISKVTMKMIIINGLFFVGSIIIEHLNIKQQYVFKMEAFSFSDFHFNIFFY